MRIAIITDIHASKSVETDFDPRVLVRNFVDRAAKSNADLLIDLGDRIDDVDRDTDLAATAELASLFEQFPGPRLHLRGNHDVVNLDVGDHLRLFGQAAGHSVIEFADFRVIAWQPSVLLDRKDGFPTTAGELPWLIDALEQDKRPAIIVTHIPVSGAAMTGNYYFENNADLATYPDHAEVRGAVEMTGGAAMWLSGHVHWNSIANVGNVYHVTVQSASERFTTQPNAAAATAQLDIDGDSARLEVFGLDPIAVTLPFRKSGEHRWPEPRPRVVRK